MMGRFDGRKWPKYWRVTEQDHERYIYQTIIKLSANECLAGWK